MNDELWLKRMKERLEDYSEPVPPSGWERLEKNLSAAGTSEVPPVVVRRRMLPIHWRVAVAAALLLAVSVVGIKLQHCSLVEEVSQGSFITAVSEDGEDLYVDDEAHLGTEKSDEVAETGRISGSPVEKNNRFWLAGLQQKPEDKTEPVQDISVEHKPVSEQYSAASKEADETDVAQAVDEAETVNETRVRRAPSSRSKYHLPVEGMRKKKEGRWAFALALSNSGIFSSGGPDNGILAMNSPGVYPLNSGKLDLSATSDGLLLIPEGQEVIFRDGLPYLLGRSKQVASINHKLPVTVGISVRKNLTDDLSVESGITYTCLASDVTTVGGEDIKQKLHYLGVPLRANWRFLRGERWELYAAAGGAIERCVYGKYGDDDLNVKPLQFSVMGALGAQLNVSHRVGLYVEPGVTYYFDDHSSVQTVRKEHPCNFSLQGGIRLTY